MIFLEFFPFGMVGFSNDTVVTSFSHPYAFDPTYGYSLEKLLQVQPPPVPADFEAFWKHRYELAMNVDPEPQVHRGTPTTDGSIHDIRYHSTGDFRIGGWLSLPRNGLVERGVVVGHGYGGRNAPDLNLPLEQTAVLFPCFRGLSRSARAPISQDPDWHVLHDIQDPEHYILGGCVEDLWLGVSTLLTLYPWLENRIGYMGTSFGGGIGALGIPWDSRIARGHLCLPTFGHHPLRMPLRSHGSLVAVQRYHHLHPEVLNTLQYYDAATAARFIQQPIHVAAAHFDPMVPPPGQFAVYNAVPGQKTLFVFDGGHFEYKGLRAQQSLLKAQLEHFFADL
jgi:cephalosporin-C deacetylase